ncbi:hypothetical protein FJT64_006641 [Amphibalanus amphitrite]|uniref:MULE transposase domain-containing protein n=1 Tax=Amphibalanus amphitrite TaxID=1232801 RepID=A0A6A4VWY3_AMPAM|nr:hypothetical protein FJT64_006641 [Amphibalanus amphitrite]
MGNQLPSLKEVLSRFFHFHNRAKKTVKEAANLVVEEVFLFWEKARISTKEKHHAAKKVINEYELWRALGKHKSRQTPTETKKREEFVTRLDLLFDVAKKDVELTLNMEDRKFLTMQRDQGGRKGVMMGIDGKLAALEKRFELLKKALGEKAFYGRQHPECFMTDNCDAERGALRKVWPESAQYLCIFHVLQQVWRWVLDSRHGVPKQDRQRYMAILPSKGRNA